MGNRGTECGEWEWEYREYRGGGDAGNGVEMRGIWVGMRGMWGMWGMGWEYGKSGWECGESGWNRTEIEKTKRKFIKFNFLFSLKLKRK